MACSRGRGRRCAGHAVNTKGGPDDDGHRPDAHSRRGDVPGYKRRRPLVTVNSSTFLTLGCAAGGWRRRRDSSRLQQQQAQDTTSPVLQRCALLPQYFSSCCYILSACSPGLEVAVEGRLSFPQRKEVHPGQERCGGGQSENPQSGGLPRSLWTS